MKLRSHKVFELFVVSVIIGSALLVGAKTYDLHPVTQTLVIWFIYFGDTLPNSKNSRS
jgi:voltage-gated sodium channel